MKDVLIFKNMQEMCGEAEEFLTKITDPEIKSCAKFLLISCYSYINEFVSDVSKKTYNNLSTLIRYELMDEEEKSDHTKLYNLMNAAPRHTTAYKVFSLYDHCDPQMKKYAQMRLMDLLLMYYIK